MVSNTKSVDEFARDYECQVYFCVRCSFLGHATSMNITHASDTPPPMHLYYVVLTPSTAYSSRIKDRTRTTSTDGTNTDGNAKKNAIGGVPATASSADPESATNVTVHLTDDSAVGVTGATNTLYSGNHAAGGANPTPFGGELHKSGSTRSAIHVGGGGAGAAVTEGAVVLDKSGKDDSTGPKKSNHLKGVAVCALGAILSSMLQFAFVYGTFGLLARRQVWRGGGCCNGKIKHMFRDFSYIFCRYLPPWPPFVTVFILPLLGVLYSGTCLCGGTRCQV